MRRSVERASDHNHARGPAIPGPRALRRTYASDDLSSWRLPLVHTIRAGVPGPPPGLSHQLAPSLTEGPTGLAPVTVPFSVPSNPTPVTQLANGVASLPSADSAPAPVPLTSAAGSASESEAPATVSPTPAGGSASGPKAPSHTPLSPCENTTATKQKRKLRRSNRLKQRKPNLDNHITSSSKPPPLKRRRVA
ncbi:hypothetical protein K435DRAFT_851698 [Dendrothele bispora CBS 962.96]|uniref:Uncharacterized protein n=1 Tax=Dendrothele bispora (strain CBS 962.96) TaxID=1314807 RepID=A0A4V4HHP5_DENBC|nr:hypothetical protein K435DRAFT_851698 [Dendrothele bispora CBS 962.96]